MGFKQVINHIKFITFQRVLGVSGSQNNFSPAVGNPQKLYPRKLGHLHIKEYQVGAFVLHYGKRFNGVGCSFHQLQKWYLGNIVFQYMQR